MNARAAAARTLASVIRQQRSLNAAMEDTIVRVAEKDRALYRELCFGVCRYFYSLQQLLQHLLSRPMKTKDSDITALMLIGFYQLWQMRVPDHAAINETVDGAKGLKKTWAKNLVNGVLRRFSREKEGLLRLARQNSHGDHPAWLAAKISAAWPQRACEILHNNNCRAPLTLRVNLRQHTRAAYSRLLQQHNIEHQPCTYAAQGIRLTRASDLERLPLFDAGACSVQDEAAQLAATLLDLAPGQRVLDACCAPGGKTCHIAEAEPQLAELTALDHDEVRLRRVEENLSRLQLGARVLHAPVEQPESWWDKSAFDRILLDAPCSATGVIRHHPDIKLLRRASDIDALSALQRKLLNSLWPTLAPGGLLVYATCSILPQENENLVQSFVERQADAIHLTIDAHWGVARPFGRQLFPAKDGHDGFYYACLKKLA